MQPERARLQFATGAAGQEAVAAEAARCFRMDETFRRMSRALRLLLHADNGRWVEAFLAGIDAAAPGGALAPADKAQLWALMAHHARIVAAGRFGAEQAASSARIARFLGQRPFTVFDLFGAWSRAQGHLMQLIVTDDRMTNRIMRRDAYATLGTWVMTETAMLSHFLDTPLAEDARALP